MEGRDCIFLDTVTLPNLGSLILSGDLNASLIIDYQAPLGWEAAEEIPFQLQFNSVLGFQMLELDTWHDQHADDDTQTRSSFDEILKSPYISSMKGHGTKLSPEHRHYQCCTYDEVFDVVAVSFTLLTGDDAQAKPLSDRA